MSAGAMESTVSRRMMMMLWFGFLLLLPSSEPKSTLIDAPFETVVGVLTVGGVGVAGVVIGGVVTVGAGSAPAAVSETLNQPHASAATGRVVTTKARRNQSRRDHVRRRTVLSGPFGPLERFGTQTLPGFVMLGDQWRTVRFRI